VQFFAPRFLLPASVMLICVSKKADKLYRHISLSFSVRWAWCLPDIGLYYVARSSV
jgi:hypothetical protein